MKYAVMLVIAVSIFNTCFDLYKSIYYGKQLGLDFPEIVSMWNLEPSLNRTYSGYEHQSLVRLNGAIYSLGSLFVSTILLWFIVNTRARNKRILEELKKCGAL